MPIPPRGITPAFVARDPRFVFVHYGGSRLNRHVRHRLAPALRLALLCLPVAAAADASLHSFKIEAGPLPQQLQTLARQSGVRVDADLTALGQRQGPALSGQRSTEQALALLLADSGYSAQARSDGSYAVRRDETEQRLSTIVVTGEKIDRPLQETTTAVSVLRDDPLNRGDLKSIYDLAGRVPNMTMNAAGAPNIRGVSGTGPASGVFTFISGARPRVSTSVDGAAETWNGQRYVDAGLWDVEQVEVLRGPQSTTQGRNTIGGAVVVNTKDPTFDWEGALRAGYENADGKTLLAGVISGPLIADELALRVAAEGLRGHGFIDYVDQDWPWDPSEIRRLSVRTKLLWKPSALPGLSAKFTVSRRDQKGEYLNTVDGDDLFAYQFHGIASNTRYQDSSNTSLHADVAYDLSDNWSSHFLYTRGNFDARFQESGEDRFSLTLDEKSDTVETRFVYAPAAGGANGVVGLYYYRRAQDLLAAPDGFVGDDHVRTAALFGEATLPLSQRLELILGGRFERESQQRDVIAWPGKPWQGHVLTDISDPIFLPKLGLAYKAGADTTLGLTARKGYNPGGGSLDWVTSEFYEYGKEEVETVEFSSRSLLLDHRLSLNANVFASRYDGYQALLNRRFVNIPKGRSRGAELEATAHVSASLEVFGALGWLDTEVTRGTAANPELAGNEFNYSPHFTANVGFRSFFGGGFFAGADFTHTGRYYSEIDNGITRKAGGYNVLNANIGYETERYTIRGYVKNATNEEILYYRTDTLGQVGAPRTAGVIVDYRF